MDEEVKMQRVRILMGGNADGVQVRGVLTPNDLFFSFQP